MTKLLKVRLRAAVIGFLCGAGSILAQNSPTVSVNIDNGTVKEVVSSIEKQTPYRISYRPDMLDKAPEVTMHMNGASVESVLAEALKGTNLTFSVLSDNTIAITDKRAAAKHAQQADNAKIIAAGTVMDASGEPIIGATVMEEGTTNGVQTNADGTFSLAVKKGARIVVSYVGMMPIITNKLGPDMKLTMSENAEVLNDVVVIGYGVQRKSDVTGAISSVKASDIQNRSITNPQAALGGKTSGVQVVTTSGQPGSAPAIRVRGYGSNSDMGPLYIVDGVKVNNISEIDPNNIESMEVLKDAASAAIYGSQAGNGVVLITTKTGTRQDKAYGKVHYSLQYANQSFGHKPRLLNSKEYCEYVTENGVYSQSDINNLGWDGVTDTNWYDVAFGHGNMMKHNVAFEGGNNRGTFYVSIGYLDNDGPVHGNYDSNSLFTGNINADYLVKPWLKIGTTVMLERDRYKNVSTNDQYGALTTSVFALDPLTPDLLSGDNLTPFMQQHKDLLLTNPDGMYYSISNYYTSSQYHPMIMRDKTVSQTTGFSTKGSFYAVLTPWKPINITSRFGYNLSSSHSRSFDRPYYGNSSASNTLAAINATTGQHVDYQWENFVNYNQTFNELHHVSAMAGMSFIENTYRWTSGSAKSSEVTDGDGNKVINPVVPVQDPGLWGYLNFAQRVPTSQ